VSAEITSNLMSGCGTLIITPSLFRRTWEPTFRALKLILSGHEPRDRRASRIVHLDAALQSSYCSLT